MSAADFLLSPEVQALVKVLFAEPQKQFSAEDLAGLSRTGLADVQRTLAHLVDSGMVRRAGGAAGEAETFGADTGFLFYRELRRIAMKSFAAAEPLRAMLRGRFRHSVQRAFILGEDPASGALDLLLVYGEQLPERDKLDLALRRLLKSGAVRQHLQAQVIPEKRFRSLTPRDAIGARLAADVCIEIFSLEPGRTKKAPERVGLLEQARRRLASLAG